MKRAIFILSLFAIVIKAGGQTVNINKTDGSVVRHYFSTVNYLDFTSGYNIHMKSGSIVSYDKKTVNYVNFTWPNIVVSNSDATTVTENSVTLTGSVSVSNVMTNYTVGFFIAINGTPSSTNFIINAAYGSLNPTGNYSITVSGLAAGTTYYYRAYTLCDEVYYYSTTNSFTTTDAVPSGLTSCPDANHPHMIDLGLPSGTKWACCNVGATAPEKYGNYYAWGETQPKSVYKKNNYAYYQNGWVNIGSDIAGTGYDAATVNWGAPWCMPSETQCLELKDNCTSIWTTKNGVNGRKFTGPNGGTIFLPAAGYHSYGELNKVGEWGQYWSSRISDYSPTSAGDLWIRSDNVFYKFESRESGHTVRPVCKN